MCAINVICLYFLLRRLNATLILQGIWEVHSQSLLRSLPALSLCHEKVQRIRRPSAGLVPRSLYLDDWFMPGWLLEVWKPHYSHDTPGPLDPWQPGSWMPNTSFLDTWVAHPHPPSQPVVLLPCRAPTRSRGCLGPAAHRTHPAALSALPVRIISLSLFL